MTNEPFITTDRMVHIFEEMIEARRMYCADHDYVRMDKVWEDLCDDGGLWKIRTFKSAETIDLMRKASLIVFGDRAILSVDEQLMQNAARGCKFSNFILAHEFGHIALDHHRNSKVTKHFKLSAGPKGLSNIPPTIEELEANYAAVFFQCGVALLDEKWSALQLAHRAFSDVYYVGKAQRLVQLDVFKRKLKRDFVNSGSNARLTHFEFEYWKDPGDWTRLMVLFGLARDEVAELVNRVWCRRL